MIQEYIVKDSFYIKNDTGAQVLVLDRKRDIIPDALEFEVDGRTVPFLLTHNESWIVVKDSANFNEKKITIHCYTKG